MTWIEGLGYLASVLVAVSLTMRSLLRLRLVNLAGAICFTTYGLLIHAYPVAAVNGAIVLINLYHLRRMASGREFFRRLEVALDSEYLREFLRFHAEDIRRFIPDFPGTPPAGSRALFVLRDMVPAGLFIASPYGPDALYVHLDYVIPGYRDLKVADFVFHQEAAAFGRQGVRALVSAPGSPAHEEYLRRIGFTRMEDGTYRAWVA